jgi:hypothetical protein
VRTLQKALMGKVKLGQLCRHEADGTPSGRWVPQTGPGTLVAVKQLYKWCMERGVTVENRPVRENPLEEVAVLARLASPGHGNVLRMFELLEDAQCLYIVLEFCGGGELFDQVRKQYGEASALEEVLAE